MSERYVSVRVRGEYALWTRPEFKSERVSYPVMTPSAARGILEAIYWHPEFRWAIREIQVLKPVKTISIFRNEVISKMSASRTDPYFADRDRVQRNSVILRDVDYVILADANVLPGFGDEHAKHRDIFRRRVEKGQCFQRPSLGCREFAAEFSPLTGEETPISEDIDLGLMLWDLDYGKKKPPYNPLFFRAVLESGVLRVPHRPLELTQ